MFTITERYWYCGYLFLLSSTQSEAKVPGLWEAKTSSEGEASNSNVLNVSGHHNTLYHCLLARVKTENRTEMYKILIFAILRVTTSKKMGVLSSFPPI